jgi:coenzyme Q-binding protein COQ10
VKNVDEYKYFVPWCEDSRIIHKKGNEMDAELTVGFKILSEKYISHILLDPPNSIRVRSPETRLFEYLINEWYFKPGPDPHSTWLEFYVSFKFRSFLYQHIVDMFFEDVVKRMVTAFETRAKHVEEEKRAKHLEERVPWTK